MLKSVDSITYCQGLGSIYQVYERAFDRVGFAIDLLSKTGKDSILYKTNHLPMFLNGERVKKAEMLAELEKLKSKKRTAIRVTYATNESKGFEMAISVRTFPSWAAFERSPFARRFSYFTSEQLEHHNLLTK